MSESSSKTRKKRPNVFANVIAGSEEVVQSSFVGSSGNGEQAADAHSDVFALAQATAAHPTPVEAEPSQTAAVPQPAAPKELSPEAPAAFPRPSLTAPAVTPEAVSTPAGPPVAPEPASAATRVDELAPALAPRQDEPQETHGGDAEEGAPAAPASVAPATGVRRRPASSRKGSAPWAHQAVLESFASATIESREWKLHGFRIVPDVLGDLKARMMADRRSTGNQKLAISHYLDAALRHTPRNVEQQITMAQKFLTERMGMVEAGRQSTYRVGPSASALVSEMNVGLQEADYGRKGIYVVSAAIESFLAALDAAGELQRPQVPGGR